MATSTEAYKKRILVLCYLTLIFHVFAEIFVTWSVKNLKTRLMTRISGWLTCFMDQPNKEGKGVNVAKTKLQVLVWLLCEFDPNTIVLFGQLFIFGKSNHQLCLTFFTWKSSFFTRPNNEVATHDFVPKLRLGNSKPKKRDEREESFEPKIGINWTITG